ncbi:MAG: transposase, partial [Actinobacteria bacterium]|nr:transposase [Actinomycetota bacterium]
NAKAALAKHRDAVSDAKHRAIEKAIAHLRKTNAVLNVSTVARRAGVTRKTVYKHDELMAIINAHRNHHGATDEPPSTSRDSSIVAALRRKIATQSSEIKELKTTVAQQQATIELLYGQLEDRHYGTT